MAVKFKLVSPPKTIDAKIKFKTLEGVDVNFSVTFNWRNQRQFGELFDEMASAVKERGALQKGKEDISMAEVMDANVGGNGKYLLRVLAAWDLESELNEENAEMLANDWPAAAKEIMETYRAICLEGRLGN